MHGLFVSDRVDQRFLTSMLSAGDVQRTDLKNDLKVARTHVSERTKFVKQFTRRRAARQKRAVSNPPEDLDAMARSMLPSKVGLAAVETQAMRDYASFRHLRGTWSRERQRTPRDVYWRRNYNVRPQRRSWASRAWAEEVSGGLSEQTPPSSAVLVAVGRRREATSKSAGPGSAEPVRKLVSVEASSSWSIPSMHEAVVERRGMAGGAGSASGQGVVGQPWRRPAFASMTGHETADSAFSELSNVSNVERSRSDVDGGEDDGDEDMARDANLMGARYTTSKGDPSTVGGELYCEMHSTRFEVARGSVRRKQERERGFTAGALARIYDTSD